MVGAQLISVAVLLLARSVTSQQQLNTEEAEPGNFPFRVRLTTTWSQGHELWFTGSLISPRTVLTVANIVDYFGTRPRGLVVTVGDETKRRIEVSRIIAHEEYRYGARDFAGPFNNVALLILAKKVDLEMNGVGVIALPTDRTLYKEGTTVTTLVYGAADEQEISDQAECAEHWKRVGKIIAAQWGFSPSIVDDMDIEAGMRGRLCTQMPPHRQRSRYGNPGSPVFVSENGSVTQIAMFSGNAPEDTGFDWVTDQDVNVDVLFYLDWIKKNMV